MNKQKGFTIIELIVVVAIIAVLAAIVLVNVTSYINKGRDAAARGNLSSILTNSAVFYDTNSTYTNFTTSVTTPKAVAADCAGNAGFQAPCLALATATPAYPITFTCAGAACNAAGATGWCAMITLKSTTNTYCVDSTGTKLEKASGTCASGVCG